MVIAGSFNETYKRNAINNGFILIECPNLVNDLLKEFGKDFQSKALEKAELIINIMPAIISFAGNEYSFNPPGLIAQELIIKDGLENWVKEKIS